MSKEILIASIYTGFNYGTSLQAFSLKTIIRELGFNPSIVAYKYGLKTGRDIRLNKILIMIGRTLFRPALFKKTFLTYKKSIGKKIDTQTKESFLNFSSQYINPCLCGGKELRKRAKLAFACICGSAQIWNPEAVYVSPLFYLRFAPQKKRIAYAPSLGKEYIPKYNKRVLKKYIAEIPYISVREVQGSRVLHELIERDVPVVLDPTLLISHTSWKQYMDIEPIIKEKYILCYFLDEPSAYVINHINHKYQDYTKISILYDFDIYKNFKNYKHISAGPFEFLNIIEHAEKVFTDSFHGLAFCLNFNKDFFIIERNYGIASAQSSRIDSLLSQFDLIDFKVNQESDFRENKINFDRTNEILLEKRKYSFDYLNRALRKMEENIE